MTDVKALIAEKLGVEYNQVNNLWLNVEPLYEEQGWTVKYEQPDYTENFDAYYEFRYKIVGK